MKRWQDWANLVLGAWAMLAPWVLGFADGDSAAAWSHWALGAAVVVLAAIAVYMPRAAQATGRVAWQEGINVLLGVALLVSPWALGFAAQSTPTTNAALVGVLVAVLALWAMLMDGTLRQRLLNRPQTK